MLQHLLGRLVCLDPKSPSYKVFAGVLSRHRWLVAAVLGSSLLAAFSEGSTLGFIFLAISAISGEPLPDIPVVGDAIASLPQTQQVILFVASAILLQVFRSALTYGNIVVTEALIARIRTELSTQVFRQIFSFSYAHAAQYKIGDLTQYISSAGPAINKQLGALNNTILGTTVTATYILVLVKISPELSGAILLLVGGLFALQKRLIPLITSISRRAIQTTVAASKRIVENIQALRVVHTFGYQREAIDEIAKLQVQLRPLLEREAVYVKVIAPLNQTFTVLIAGSVLIAAYLLFRQNSNSVVSALFTYVAALNRLGTQVQNIARNYGSIAQNAGRLDRLNYILSESDKEFDRSGHRPFLGLKSGVRFEAVSLCYDGSDRDAVCDLTFEMPKGSVTALVGGSGAGKSSVVDLLIGLYEPTQGQILIDGVPAQDWRTADWRARLGVVGQDTFIFNCSILENIRYGSPQASEAEIVAAATDAQAHEFITALPDGYETTVGERGYRLSGGQRQRLALARAILRQPDVLILDEATSALDSQSERLIQDALDRFQENRTVLAIAHRLSTIVRADTILVMEAGKIVERGTHRELLALDSRYAAYWKLQSADSQLVV